MAFAVNVGGNSSSEGKVNYDDLNNYIVETAGLEDRTTLVGIVSGIVDLGIQEQEDAEIKFEGDADAEAAEIEKFPSTYFKDGIDEVTKKPARFKCFKQKPIQSVAVAVDFPDIIVDKGQFYGESNPQPLRLWLGGQFFIQGVGMVIGRPIPLKNDTSTGKWSFRKNHIFHKMAVAAKLIKADEPFVSRDIDQLLGKAFQFDCQVYIKNGKYYTEYIKFNGGVARGQAVPELPFDPFVVEFNGNLTPENMLNLRNHVINTIKRANNYAGSKIQGFLEAAQEAKEQEQGEREAPAKKAAPKLPAKPSKPVEDEVDSESPF